MNWSNIWELVKVNILYSNPQLLVNIRNKQAKKPKKKIQAYKSVLSQQLFSMLLIGVLYSALLAFVDYASYPGIFTMYLSTFVVLTFVSAFPPLFTVFYDSQDTRLYLPLPLKPGEILLAKVLSTLGQACVYLLPALGLLTFLYWRLTNPLLALLLALFNFLVITLVTLSLSVILVNRVGALLVKSPYKKVFSTGILILSQVIAVGGIVFLNANNAASMEGQHPLSLPLVPFLSGFYHVAINPFSLDSLLHYWIWIVALAVLIFILIKTVIPSYHNQLLLIDSTPKVNRQRRTKNHGVRKLWIRHHLATLKIPALWTSALFSSTMMLFMLIGPLTSGDLKASLISPGLFGISLFIGTFIGMSSTVLTMVGISLERENYTFIKALPINFNNFIKEKFILLWLLQSGLPALIYCIIGGILGFHPALIFCLVAGIFLASLVGGQFDFRRDQKNLMLNWQNINQLLTRGNRQMWTALLVILLFITYIAITVLAVILASRIGEILVSLTLTFIVLAIIIGLQIYLYFHFWKKM
ncbi:hypothetical protein [Streptococcus plurextorum]|uniref:hypothetical protein n=1 Tax=Streptococcus plurextorum TaxID=456876 RepID=UPI0003FACA10|nr:hypothetical protein [Streptococcus plurextorum]